MERKEGWINAGCVRIFWAVTVILLCAAPTLKAETVPAGETWDIPSTEHPGPIIGNLWVDGTANILTEAHITQELGANAGSTVNIYGGQIDWWLATYPTGDPTENPNVTVYGPKFRIGTGQPFAPPLDTPIMDTLYVLSEDESAVLFSLIIFSDIPIHLRAPSTAITVDIDIKPGSDINPINQGSNGVVPVAILTTDSFDASTVDPGTVTLAGAEVAVRGKSEKLMARMEDIDGDGDDDLLLQVETQSDDALWESGTVTLLGKTYDGQDIMGTDEVIIVPPE